MGTLAEGWRREERVREGSRKKKKRKVESKIIIDKKKKSPFKDNMENDTIAAKVGGWARLESQERMAWKGWAWHLVESGICVKKASPHCGLNI